MTSNTKSKTYTVIFITLTVIILVLLGYRSCSKESCIYTNYVYIYSTNFVVKTNYVKAFTNVVYSTNLISSGVTNSIITNLKEIIEIEKEVLVTKTVFRDYENLVLVSFNNSSLLFSYNKKVFNIKDFTFFLGAALEVEELKSFNVKVSLSLAF